MEYLKKFTPLFIILLTYFCFSFLTYRDFGISTDEPVEYRWGKELLNHLGNETKYENSIVKTYEQEPSQRRHTPILSKYNRWYPALVSLLNEPGFYERAHLINMGFFSILLITAYTTLLVQYQKTKPATIATIFVLLTPLLVGNAPINPKDMPFAVMYFLSVSAIYVSMKFVKDPMKRILLLSIPFSLTQGMRIIGFTLYIIFAIYSFMKTKKINVIELILLFCVASFFMIWVWPNVGVNYIQNFYHVLLDAKNYEYWNKSILFLGQYINVGERPWYYLFVYIFITTPIYILALLFLNVRLFKDFLNNDIIQLSWLSLSVNIILYLVLHPTIYNGMRHFIYLLPFISVVAGLTLYDLLINNTQINFRKISVVFVLINIVLTIISMYKLHPYEYSYFNELVGGTKKAYRYFETDYWNLSYKDSFYWLLNNGYLDKEEINYIAPCNQSDSIKYYAKINNIKVETSWKTPVNNYFEICDLGRTLERNYDLASNENLIHIIYKDQIPLSFIFLYSSPNQETLSYSNVQ